MFVPRTDTGPLALKAKALGRIELREFGNLAPYVSNKGCLLSYEQVAVTREVRLFNKNIAGC